MVSGHRSDRKGGATTRGAAMTLVARRRTVRGNARDRGESLDPRSTLQRDMIVPAFVDLLVKAEL